MPTTIQAIGQVNDQMPAKLGRHEKQRGDERRDADEDHPQRPRLAPRPIVELLDEEHDADADEPGRADDRSSSSGCHGTDAPMVMRILPWDRG